MAPIAKKTPDAGSSSKSGSGLIGRSPAGKSSSTLGYGGKTSTLPLGKSANFGSGSKSSNSNAALIPKSSNDLGTKSKSNDMGFKNNTSKSPVFGGKSSTSSDLKGNSVVSSKSSKPDYNAKSSQSYNSGKSKSDIGKTNSYSSKSTLPLDHGGKKDDKSKNNIATDNSKMYSSDLYASPKHRKSRSAFGFIWIPGRKSNKKKEMVYHTYNNDHDRSRDRERSPSMYKFMSGDSPDYQSHKKEEEQNLVDDNTKVSVAIGSGTVATATVGVSTADGPEDITASTTPTEKQEFIKRDEDDAAGDTNDDDNSDYLENNEPLTEKSPGNKWDPQKEKVGDKVDSVYLRPPPPHKARSTASTPEEESCGFKCLYYTLECCDCVIM